MTDQQAWTEMRLFEEAGAPEPHARAHDPESSELTVKSLGRDTGYNWRIFLAIVSLSERTELRHYDDGDSIAVIHDRPVTDDDIVAWMERSHGRRYQRNVVARQRGIIREAGWIQPVADCFRPKHIRGNGPLMVVAHIPTHAGVEALQRYLREKLSST